MDNSVLFVDQFGEIGGGQVVLQALVKVAREDGRRVGVLAPIGGALEEALEATWGNEVTLHGLKGLSLQSRRKGLRDVLSLLAYCLYVLRFWFLIRAYHTVYVNGARLALPFFLLSLLTWKQRWCYHVHLCHTGVEKRIFSIIAASRRTSSLIMASRFIYDDFARTRPEIRRSNRCRIVENGLSAPFLDLPFSDRFSERRRPLTVALIGRVVPYKGHGVLPELARTFPNLRFVIVGACGEESGDLLRSIMGRQYSNLEYLGETRDLPGLIARESVHCSIVPSRWEEPFGLVSIESMAASCITLVSNRGMLPYIAEATGAWCFRDDEELSAMLGKLCAMNPDDSRDLARRQYETTRLRFGFSAFRTGILSVLAGLSDSRETERGNRRVSLLENYLAP